jgi:hypothetical protein
LDLGKVFACIVALVSDGKVETEFSGNACEEGLKRIIELSAGLECEYYNFWFSRFFLSACCKKLG